MKQYTSPHIGHRDTAHDDQRSHHVALGPCFQYQAIDVCRLCDIVAAVAGDGTCPELWYWAHLACGADARCFRKVRDRHCSRGAVEVRYIFIVDTSLRSTQQRGVDVLCVSALMFEKDASGKK